LNHAIPHSDELESQPPFVEEFCASNSQDPTFNNEELDQTIREFQNNNLEYSGALHLSQEQ